MFVYHNNKHIMTSITTTTTTAPVINMSNVSGDTPLKTLMEKEKILVDKLNIFYKEYATYLRCVSCNLNGGVKCDRSACNATKFNDAYDDIRTFIGENGAFAPALQDLKNNSSLIDTANYEERYKQIKQFHKNIMNTRRELDEKLNFIENSQQSHRKIYENNYDNSLYTGILWTTLATSLIFYAFMKL